VGKLQRAIGWAWASPLTLLGFLAITLLQVFGWCKRNGTFGSALVWTLQLERSPTWLHRKLHLHSGCSLGNVVLLDADLDTHHGRVTLKHHQEHVRQAMALGVLHPLAYAVCWLVLASCDHSHPFWDHPLEIDARRSASQTIDVIGALRRAVAEGKLKPHT
jgi:hypothetical protein